MSDSNDVLQALQLLYQGADQNSKAQANQWLQDFQKKDTAWVISDSILRNTDLGLESRLFAAQTLRFKIINNFKELDPSSGISLKDSLIQHLVSSRNGSQALITQLCLALADLALQLVSWEDPVKEMIDNFTSDSSSISVLLEFLTVLPEEVDNNDRILVERAIYTERANKLLTLKSMQVVELLVNCLQSSALASVVQTKVLDCFSAWLKSGELTLNLLQRTPLLDLAFAALQSDDEHVFETAVDAICGYIFESRDSEGQDTSTPEYNNIINQTRNTLLEKLAALSNSMRNDSSISTDEDTDKMRGYCRIFTEAGEAWVKSMTEQPSNFRNLLESMLTVMRFPSLEVLPMTFNFWASITDSITVRIHSASNQEKEMISSVYFPVFNALIEIVIVHLRYPQSYDGFSIESENSASGWSAKDRDDFSDFRHNIGDVLKDSVKILGQELALQQPYNILAEQLSNPQQGSQPSWQIIEAPLFAIRAMGSEVDQNENVVLPKIMDLLPRFPYHPKLRYSATLVLGRYTEWTFAHPQYIPFQLDYISSGFELKEVVAASTQALKYLCKDCNQYMVSYWKQLETFYSSVALTSNLPDEDIIDLTEALSHVIAAIPMDSFPNALEAFCSPTIKSLESLLSSNTDDKKTKLEIAKLLSRLTVLLRHANGKKIPDAHNYLLQMINVIWPLLVSSVKKFSSDSDVSESSGRLLRVIMSRYSYGNASIYNEGIQLLLSAFQNTGFGVYIWVARKFVEKYASDTYLPAESESVNLSVACSMLVEKIGEIMISSVSSRLSDFDSIPEPLEEYYLLLSMALQKQPARTITSSSFLQSLQLSITISRSVHYYVQEAVLEAWSALIFPAVRNLSIYRDDIEASAIKFSIPIHSNVPPYLNNEEANKNSANKTDNANQLKYNINQMIFIFNNIGAELSKVLLEGLITSTFPDLITFSSSIYTSLVQLVTDGGQLFGNIAANDANTLPISAALINQVERNNVSPKALVLAINFIASLPAASNISDSEKESFLNDYSLHLSTSHFARLRRLISDFSLVYRRKNNIKLSS
ncbi:hypothetical protein AYI69_g6045 [Smittium culicis]|uniref:Importin N-terminal domain-containing protein n=1 Tax=Smittium culicis TaxID=133412 RepID=A0A1R1Y1X6_9FUNG|nr:hypothetical protein AYI69_g6045 [Smittium culicis]